MKIDLAVITAIQSIEDHNAKVYRAAMYYAGQGIPVIPIPYGEKHLNSKTIYTSRCSARSAKIEEWFDPTRGIYRGFNIALGCGDYYGKGGIFVVDVDTKYAEKYGDDIWGVEAWNELESEYGNVYGPVQRTPSGGLHVVAQWKENLTPSQNKIALGIDTRGGHPGKVSSHIMAFPSVVDGVEYIWERGGDIVLPPTWVSDKMGVAWKKDAIAAAGGAPGRGSELMGAEDLEEQVPMSRVAEILFSINPDDLDYDEWVRIGQAIHSQHGGQEALALWDEWSQQGARYEAGECHTRWRGFKENGPVRMATLFYIAQNRGTASKLTEEDAGSEDGMVADIIDEYNSKYALVLMGEQVKVIKKEGVPDSIQTKYSTYAVEAFRTYYSNDRIMVQDDKGNPKPVKKVDLWMSSPRRRSFDGMILHPAKPRVIELAGHQYLNTWAGFAVESLQGDWSLMKTHILDNLCCGNMEHYEWLMDWMADMFQEPADPKGCAVVLGGIEGAGKGTLANALAKVFGLHASIVSNSDHLVSKYNDMIMDSVFLFADEVVYAGSHDVANRLKAMVTEKTNTREKKFGDMKKVDSFLHIMMSTNNEWKVAAGPESRRWLVLQVKSEVANQRAYFGAIKEQMDNGGHEAMLYELSHRQILSNLRYAPVTDELKAQRTLMQVQSLYDSFPAWLAYVIDTGNIGVNNADADMAKADDEWPTKVDKSALWESYADWSRKYKPRAPVLATSVFYPKLLSVGFSEGPRIRVGSSRVRTILVPQHSDLCNFARTAYAIETTNSPEESEIQDEM